MNRLYLLFLLIICFSCVENKSHIDKNLPDNNVEQLIEKNKDKRLFLSFWAGMMYDEFVKIKEFENKSGNLKNDRFFIHPIDFEVINDNESKRIKLTYNSIDNSPYYSNQEEAIIKYEKDGLNEIIETLDKKYNRFDKEFYINSIKTKMNFPVEIKDKISYPKIDGTIINLTTPYTYVHNHKSIFWRDNNRVINLEYTITGDFEKSIKFYLTISYALFNDFTLDIEKELIEQKKEIERKNKEIEQIEIETAKSKEHL